ncbi:hypothetical protein GN956_G974 [Arapaima gigas]
MNPLQRCFSRVGFLQRTAIMCLLWSQGFSCSARKATSPRVCLKFGRLQAFCIFFLEGPGKDCVRCCFGPSLL